MKDKTDEELMLAYQYGDELAFKILFERHSGRVYGYLLKQLKDRRQADDVFQDTFLKLHRSRGLYKSKYLFLPWLFTICKSVLIDFGRALSRRLEIPVKELPEVTVEEPKEHEISRMGLLSEPQKSAIEMRFKDDLSFEEIAKRIDSTPANARQLVSRAIRKLRGKK